MIYFDKVSKVYDEGDVALEDISFTISPGDFVTIVGPSGAGKSSIIRLILGDEKPTTGTVSFESQDVHKIKQRHIPAYRRRIGTVFQDFRLLPDKTAYENIAFAMEAAGKSDDDIKADVPHVLGLVDLTEKADRFPSQLSGGEQQRLAIARAIINQPDVVIADEPTGNLDPNNAFEVIEILKKINDLGTTVLLTTHNKGVVDSLHKRVITLEGGKITRDEEKGKYVL